jgi:hypothetical protein
VTQAETGVRIRPAAEVASDEPGRPRARILDVLADNSLIVLVLCVTGSLLLTVFPTWIT